MLKEERQQFILETLRLEGKVLATEVSLRLCVSEDTIRRDLRDLNEAGKIQRVHGGALPRSPAEVSYSERLKIAPEAKAHIARAALQLLHDGQVILMDGGTTTLQIARIIPASLKATVFTNSIPIAAALSEHPSIETIVIGGSLLKSSQVMTGGMTLQTLQSIRTDLCLLGICSLDPVIGISVPDLEESYVKRAMVGCSREVAALVTTDKLGTASTHIVAPLVSITYLVADCDTPPAALQPYSDAGVKIIT